ncbi:arsenate reductase/protein-tyrosine-phosphatase family protein [Blastococcus sp. SYSU D01042]
MRLLFVCTGNICRSAAAHVLTAAWPAGHMGLTFDVRSGGTHARPGRAAHPFTAAALERRGLTAESHVARRLSAADLDWADIVLTMTAQHREAVLTLDPRALRRTFTLREAADLCGDLAAHRLTGVPSREGGRALAAALAEARAGRRADQEDIDDPVDGSAAMHTRVVDEIAAALRTLLVAMSRQMRSTGQPTLRLDHLPPVPLPV